MKNPDEWMRGEGFSSLEIQLEKMLEIQEKTQELVQTTLKDPALEIRDLAGLVVALAADTNQRTRLWCAAILEELRKQRTGGADPSQSA